ncbi:MAG: tetratricopeptide repeat protein, partial [Wenzhouxiangella sp.]|nr:tetratricopeptide repeat protein [Wenzhouxiangella sp.]
QLAGLTPAEIERAVCDSIAVKPSAMVAGSRDHPPGGLGETGVLKRRLRGDLDRIVMSAMRHEPERRYAAVAALSDDIQRYLANKPVRARGSSRLYRMGKFIARHRAGVGATAVAFAALTTALILVQIQAREAREQAERAELASQFLTEMIGRADPFAAAAEPTLASALRASIPNIADRFSDQPELEADMRYAIGYALQNLGQIPEARVQLERAQRIRDQLDDPVDQAQAYDAMGIVDWWESDFAGASAWFERALERLAEQRSERAHRQRFNVLNNYSAMLIETGQFERSAELAYEALDLVATSDVEFDPANQATLWSNLATTLEGLDDFEGSESAFQRSLAIRRDAGIDKSPDYAITLNNLAYLHLRQDRFDEAIAGQKRSVEILEQTLGETHPEVFVTSMNLSRMLVTAGDLAQAEAYAGRALDIGRATMDENNPRLGKAYEANALVREAQNRRDEALALAERARRIYLATEAVNPAWMEAIDALIQRLRHSGDSTDSG